MNVSSISSFENIKGGVNAECKDVYFVRAVGTISSLKEDVIGMDDRLYARSRGGTTIYKRFSALPKQISPETVEFYSKCYEKWISDGMISLYTRIKASEEFSRVLSEALKQTLKIFRLGKNSISSSIEKNFAVKMMLWLDNLCEEIIKQWNIKISIKIAADNIVKRQEYLFFYMLTLIGSDVILIQSHSDIDETDERLGLSEKFVLGDFSDVIIPPYQAENKLTSSENIIRTSPEKKSSAESDNHTRTEKTFEELAQLASSVVMIGIFDITGKIIGTGSGIMIGKDGYILTNNHVTNGGRYYSVRIEDDDNFYDTDEIIKYNPTFDLAIIRIQRKLNPVPIYNGEKKLVRGQKVVAIGSPLGLFNSVSDGIISGFRKISDIDMIQFTAPTSQGSSGGAVLNMYGEVIGISTSGIDAGQNINLAVGYDFINEFIKGFV